MKPYKFSIIIPAFNEEVWITKTLGQLVNDDALINVQILVICNGCTDNTYAKSLSFINESALLLKQKNIDCLVFKTPKASKTQALNIGIEHSQPAIKVLLDADIKIFAKDLNLLVDELLRQKVLAISPRVEFAFAHSSFVVRQYYQVAQRSFYNTDQRLSNVIALNKGGIEKIYPLPDITADDEYIRRKFNTNEIAVSTHCSFTFTCAKDIANLLQILTRIERGNVELNKYFKTKAKKHTNHRYNLPLVCMTFFILIKLIVKTRARLQLFLGKTHQWERDESNRVK